MKKGQGAIEFLMTYGWVMALGLVAIAALSFFFGLFSIDNFVADTCSTEPGMSCLDATFYTFDDQVAGYDGWGLIGFSFTNSLGKTITHAYVVIDPDDPYCGGHFGFLASPPFLDVMKNGDTRLAQFVLLNYICQVSDDCTKPPNQLSPYKYCYQKLNLCLDNEDVGGCALNPAGVSYCVDHNVPHPDTGYPISAPNFACIDPETPGTDQCYAIPSLSRMDYLVCGCYGGACPQASAQPSNAELQGSYNCCDASFTHGAATLPPWIQQGLVGSGGFCPGYNLTTLDPYPNSICPNSVMTDIDVYDVDFTIVYRLLDSSIFHHKKGSLRLQNAGTTTKLSSGIT